MNIFEGSCFVTM